MTVTIKIYSAGLLLNIVEDLTSVRPIDFKEEKTSMRIIMVLLSRFTTDTVGRGDRLSSERSTTKAKVEITYTTKKF